MPIYRPRVVGSVILVVILVIIGASTQAQTSQANTRVILNLLNDQQYFGAPHIYQGDRNNASTSQWPVYYGPSTASQYWKSTTINQPVLEIVPARTWSAGAMFWQEHYSGGPVTITMVGTFSSGSQSPADGFVIYLFLPLSSLTWRVSPAYNYSIPYKVYHASPIQGEVIFPQSFTPYIVVQWNPHWQTSARRSGATGQWNVFIASNPSGNNPSVGPIPSPNLGGRYAGWGGIGTGAFLPKSGDVIIITVTYDPGTNTLTGVATNLNTKQSAKFSLSLGGYYTPPSSGDYMFGVGAGTGDAYNNWALLYVATTQQYTPSLTTFTVTKTTTVTIPVTTTVTATVAVPVTRTSTVTATTTVLSTVISTTTVTTTTTTTTTITAFGYISVDFWILVAVLAILLAVVIMLSRRTSRKIAIEPMDTRVR
ncbi:MAG: hypothetical protein ACO2PN_03885 [Pyrobaculum sp.]|jgi:hypothetical protein